MYYLVELVTTRLKNCKCYALFCLIHVLFCSLNDVLNTNGETFCEVQPWLYALLRLYAGRHEVLRLYAGWCEVLLRLYTKVILRLYTGHHEVLLRLYAGRRGGLGDLLLLSIGRVCFRATAERVLTFLFMGYILLLFACFGYPAYPKPLSSVQSVPKIQS